MQRNIWLGIQELLDTCLSHPLASVLHPSSSVSFFNSLLTRVWGDYSGTRGWNSRVFPRIVVR